MKNKYPFTVYLLSQEVKNKKDFLISKGFNISTLFRNFIIQLYEKEKTNLYKV